MYIVSFYVKIRLLADKMLDFRFVFVNWPVEWHVGAVCGFPWTNIRFPLEERPVSLGGAGIFGMGVRATGKICPCFRVYGLSVLKFLKNRSEPVEFFIFVKHGIRSVCRPFHAVLKKICLS